MFTQKKAPKLATTSLILITAASDTSTERKRPIFPSHKSSGIQRGWERGENLVSDLALTLEAPGNSKKSGLEVDNNWK